MILDRIVIKDEWGLFQKRDNWNIYHIFQIWDNMYTHKNNNCVYYNFQIY